MLSLSKQAGNQNDYLYRPPDLPWPWRNRSTLSWQKQSCKQTCHFINLHQATLSRHPLNPLKQTFQSSKLTVRKYHPTSILYTATEVTADKPRLIPLQQTWVMFAWLGPETNSSMSARRLVLAKAKTSSVSTNVSRAFLRAICRNLTRSSQLSANEQSACQSSGHVCSGVHPFLLRKEGRTGTQSNQQGWSPHR